MDTVYEVNSGETLTGITLEADLMYVYDGGTASSTTVDGYYDDDGDYSGELRVYDGGAAIDTTVGELGNMYVEGTANGITVDGGFVDISGTANDVVVNGGGRVDIYGTATAVTENGGYVYDVGDVTFVANTFSDVWLEGTSATVHSGTVADGTKVSGYYDDESEEGRYSELYVYDGGIANNTDVCARGELNVYDGGVASGTTLSGYWDDDEYEWLRAKLYVEDGGVANDTTIYEGGRLYVEDGGVANGITVEGSYDDYYGLRIEEGGVANDTTVGEHGSMYVGGTANGITVDSGYVDISGAANDVVVNRGGRVDIYGTATAVTENGGYVYDVGDVTFVANTFSDVWLRGTSATVHSGTVAESTMVYGLYDEDDEIHNGELHVYDGGIANNTTVDEDGKLYVYEGGVANNTNVYEDGYVEMYGTANGITVDGGFVDISGTANDVVVNIGGIVEVYGTATAVTENGGYIFVDDEAKITFTANTFSDLELIGDGASVHAGTVAKNISVSGYYDDDEELVDGGLDVYAGGVADGVTVDDGGKLWIDKGGKFTGKLTVYKGGEVCLTEGSVVDFGISVVSPGSAALVNDWSLVNDHGAFYTITTSETQAVGVYALAGGAAAFNESITVNTDSGTQLGTLTVGGKLINGKHIYELGIADSIMSLTVTIDTEPPVKPVAKADITAKTGKNVTVTATFSDDSVVKEYSLDNKTWKNYTGGVVFTANGTAYFRAADEAGNISDVTAYAVTNIDPSMAPTGKPVDGKTSQDKPVVDYKAELDYSGVYTVTGKFGTMKGSVTIYDGGKKVASGSIKAGVLNFKKNALLDNKKSYTIEIKNTDKKSAGDSFSWTLTAKELFTKGDNTDDTLAKAKTLAAGASVNDWVGYGDAVDYYRLGVNANGGFYDLGISGVGESVKLTVYDKNGKKIKGVSASAKKPNIALNGLCLANGSYAVVEAPKAAKAKNSDYKLSLTEKATFTGMKNNDWSQAEVLKAGDALTGTLTKAAGGDVVDYYDVSKIDTLYFDMTAGKTKVSFFDKDRNKVKVAEVKMANDSIKKNASSLTLAAGNATTDNFTLAAIDDAVKYLKIEASGKTLNGYTITKIA